MQRKSFVRAIAGAALSLLAPKKVAASCGSEYHAAIYDAAARYGTSGDWLIQVMCCESGGDAGALNPNTGDSGLFQYQPGTFYSFVDLMGGEYDDYWDPYQQIEVTAWAFANGYCDHWVCGCWDGSPS